MEKKINNIENLFFHVGKIGKNRKKWDKSCKKLKVEKVGKVV